ncbi:unnamed protein product [Clavelina lepadiformis]|uniref:Uncharacterized protein n=1 Tax=Clavelina lepadiformis TaxID=159417 RepID=A0ABP0F2L2_CLALP
MKMFDEQGRGLGIEDKFEVHDSQLGYVMGYRDRDTYDQKMLGRPRSRSGSITSSNKQSASNSPLLLRPNSSSSRSRSPII